MQIEKRDSSSERRILTAMIVDPIVLGRISARGQKDLFKSRWSNLVSGWCQRYFEKYRHAPGKEIEELFSSWASRNEDEDTTRLVDKFLQGLSGEYERLEEESNSEFTLDLAGTYFNRVKKQRLIEQIQQDIENDEDDKADARLNDYSRVELGVGSYTDVFDDKHAIQEAFEDHREPLIHYPGALGQFFGESLERDGFIAIQASEKKGKTWWLMDMAHRSVLEGRKTAFFSVGDMSRAQMLRRWMIRVAGHPRKAKIVKIPKALIRDPDSQEADIVHNKKRFNAPINWKTAWRKLQEIKNEKLKGDGKLLRLSEHPNSSISVSGIASIIETWSRTGWVPDVVVIDYVDILAPINNSDEDRASIFKTWKALRALSQKLHGLVITATQADAASYNVYTQTMSNFSEDKRKYGQVTGMFALNATPAEKEMGLMRLNWLALRESDFDITKCCYVAGCLDIGKPAMKSIF